MDVEEPPRAWKLGAALRVTRGIVDLLAQIKACGDRELLQAVIQVAQERLWLLDSGACVQVVLRGGAWYAVVPELATGGKGSNKVYKLGKRLTRAALLQRLQRKPPSPLDFEVSLDEVQKNVQLRREVGRLEEDFSGGKRNRYYDSKAFQKARREWHEWQELAFDPISLVFGISVSGMKFLRQLEAQGFQLRFPND